MGGLRTDAIRENQRLISTLKNVSGLQPVCPAIGF